MGGQHRRESTPLAHPSRSNAVLIGTFFSLQTAYQPLAQSTTIRLFRPLLPDNTNPAPVNPPSSPSPPSRSSSVRTSAFRLRRGRGGIIRLDRRSEPRSEPLPRSQSHWNKTDRRTAFVDDLFADEWTSLPTSGRRARILEEDEDETEPMEGVEDVVAKEEGKEARTRAGDEYARRISERWRYDAEVGVVGVGMGLKGLEGEERVIIDDYEDRSVSNTRWRDARASTRRV